MYKRQVPPRHRTDQRTTIATNEFDMSKPRQTQHFAEIEYCLQNYFNSQLAPVMKEAQTYLTQKQVEEIGAYHASTAGVLRSLANGANGMPDDSLPYLRPVSYTHLDVYKRQGISRLGETCE